jgi:putative hydrolase of the HAD superfamily
VIRGVLFDLDDTLFDQRRWLEGAWRAVATAAAGHADPGLLFEALVAVAAEGSARGRIIDRALERVGAPTALVPELVAVFRRFEASDVQPYAGVDQALLELRAVVPTGLVTDGDARVQRAKIRAVGIEHRFDVIVLSDELGRECRKPHPAPFRRALEALGLEAEDVVHVGDHPDKDVRGATAIGMRAVRVLTGEYRCWRSDPDPWMTVPDAVEACRRLRDAIFWRCPI